MTRLYPRSLFGQTLVILLAGLFVSHLVGGWIYASDRDQAVRAIGGLGVTQRIVNVTRLIDDTPPNWRERIVAASSDPSFRIALSTATPSPAEENGGGPMARAMADTLHRQLPNRLPSQVRVAVSGAPISSVADTSAHFMAMGTMMHGVSSWRELQVAIELVPEDRWLSFTATLPDASPLLSLQSILSMAGMAVIVLVVSIWAVQRLTVPLRALADAAGRLGKDIKSPPIAERGTSEMRVAAHAFNEMQTRLRRMIDGRTRMLAAISHDLRTPLTLLRLRTEAVENKDERDKMLGTIATMNEMIEASLAFARDETAAEPRRPVDLTALVGSIVDDMIDAGLAVEMKPAGEVICECQPIALRRAITNLLDNAIRYGKRAHVILATGPQTIEIAIDDEGPGIPTEELAAVLQPFYRLDRSRNPEKGGIGLGLAIALTIVEAHGGRLALTNRPEGGLRAAITLPR
jgi:signal transduction histidine kinase